MLLQFLSSHSLLTVKVIIFFWDPVKVIIDCTGSDNILGLED